MQITKRRFKHIEAWDVADKTGATASVIKMRDGTFQPVFGLTSSGYIQSGKRFETLANAATAALATQH